MMINFLIYVLFAISFIISGYVMVTHQAIWQLVALYWAVLALKNYIDYVKTKGDE